MDYFFKFGLTFLLIMCTPLSIDCADSCVKTGPCKCVFSNGTGIDLTPDASVPKTEFYTAQIYAQKKIVPQVELITYYYHPCSDALPPVPTLNTNDTCNKNLSVCRHVFTMDFDNTTTSYKMDAGVANFMGSTLNSVFSPDGDSITYTNLPSNTTVLLICAQTDDKLHINSVAEPNAIVLSFYSRNACLKTIGLPPDESGRSLGSTLLIILFSFIIFYLVLGICTKKFLMGATGVEVLPNLAFWSDLPNLVKDGWAFAIAGFKLPVRGSGPAMTPDPNSYDSI